MTHPTQTTTQPFSVRFTADERARLESEAAGVALGTLIRAKALGQPLPSKLRRTGAALKDRAAFAKALALLGQSRLASNLNQLAHLANVGALPVDAETESELADAVSVIREIRLLLLIALGMKEDSP